MINYFKNNNLVTVSLASVLLFLATWSVYGFMDITKLGLYSDDWERYHLYTFSEETSFGDKASMLLDKYPFVLYRATNLLIIPMAAVLGDWVGNPILSIHLVSFAFNFATALLLFGIIRQLTRNCLFSILSSIFVLTLPGRSATYFWGSTQVEMLSIFFMFLSIFIHLNVKIPILTSSLLIVFASSISVLSYEVTAFIPLIFLILLIFSPIKRNLLHFLSSGLGVAVILFYKFYAYSKIFHLMEIKELDSLALQPSSMIRGLLEVTIKLFSQIDTSAILMAWNKGFDTKVPIYILLSLVLVFVLLAYKRVGLKFDGQTYTLLLLGISIILGSIIVYTLSMKSGGEFSIYGKNSRFTTLPVVGSGLILIYIFSMLKNATGTISRYVLSALVLLCVLNSQALSKERISYISTWVAQKEVLESLDMKTLQFKDRVFVFVLDAEKTGDFAVPLFEDFWTLTYAMSVLGNNPGLEADFASNPYGKLDKDGRYRSKNWEKYYYTNDQLYMVNLKDNHPRVVPLFARN